MSNFHNERNLHKSRSYYRRLLLFIICLVCMAALTACQQSGLFTNNGLFTNSDEDGGTYTLSNEIVIPAAKLRNINPVTSIDNDFYHVNRLLYSSLITLDDTLAPQPLLAASWSFTENNTIVFDLNSGIKFSDGSDFDAQDVVFSFNAYKNASQSAYLEKISHIRSVRADGDHRVEFTFNSSGNISISYFDFPIVSSDQFSSVRECTGLETGIIHGTGQYKIDSVDMNREISLIPNENYFGQKAENNITVLILPVADPYIGLVKVGNISVYISKGIDREELSGDSDLSVTEFTSNEFETLGFNCASGVFADVNLRKAVAHIIDRDEIIRTAYYNSGMKSDDLYFPGYYGTETTNSYKPDADKAGEYLMQAGYTDADGDGILEDESGKQLSITLAVNEENSSRVTAANIVVDQLKNSGINVNLKLVSSASYPGVISAGSYDMFIGGWQVSDDYDLRQFYHSEHNNYVGYINETLNGYLDRMHSGISSEEMLDTLNQAKQIIQDEAPYICLMYKTYAAATSTDLEGLVAPRFNNYYYACDDWKIKIYTEEEQVVEETAETDAEE